MDDVREYMTEENRPAAAARGPRGHDEIELLELHGLGPYEPAGADPGDEPERKVDAGHAAQVDLHGGAAENFLIGKGKLERDELLRTFNMGVGMILVLPLENHRAVEAELKRRREKFYRIGQIKRCDPRKPQVVYTGKLPL